MKNLMIISLLALAPTLASAADGSLLSCGNNQQSLHLFDRPVGGLDTYGQVSLGHFHAVNVICNNAVGLIGAKANIRCVGVDYDDTIVDIIVKSDNGNYSWNRISCTK
jgi:hypothetical protein